VVHTLLVGQEIDSVDVMKVAVVYRLCQVVYLLKDLLHVEMLEITDTEVDMA
jgi:hypothetical protein